MELLIDNEELKGSCKSGVVLLEPIFEVVNSSMAKLAPDLTVTILHVEKGYVEKQLVYRVDIEMSVWGYEPVFTDVLFLPSNPFYVSCPHIQECIMEEYNAIISSN